MGAVIQQNFSPQPAAPPRHPAFPHGGRGRVQGQPVRWGGGVEPCPPLTTDLAAVAKGLQRASACQRWALPPRRPEQGCADAVAVLQKSRAASVPHPSLTPPNCNGNPLNCNSRTHRGIPAGTAGLVGTAGARHLQSAIAVKLQRRRGTPQVPGPGLGAAELLRGEEQQSGWVSPARSQRCPQALGCAVWVPAATSDCQFGAAPHQAVSDSGKSCRYFSCPLLSHGVSRKTLSNLKPKKKDHKSIMRRLGFSSCCFPSFCWSREFNLSAFKHRRKGLDLRCFPSIWEAFQQAQH